jgi:hypothetical protein
MRRRVSASLGIPRLTVLFSLYGFGAIQVRPVTMICRKYVSFRFWPSVRLPEMSCENV